VLDSQNPTRFARALTASLGVEMTKAFAFLLMLSVSALAADDEHAFVERVTSIGQAHDGVQWRALFCEARKESSADARTLRYFTTARLSEPGRTKHTGATHTRCQSVSSHRRQRKCVHCLQSRASRAIYVYFNHKAAQPSHQVRSLRSRDCSRATLFRIALCESLGVRKCFG
jgi:hypothetical protein